MTEASAGFFQGSRVSTLRSMVFYATGALVGLAIAGYGLFTAQGTSTRSVPAEDLALVNQRPILRSDFITQLESETGKVFGETTRKEQLNVLDEMIREELLVQRGLELDFAETDQDARNALVSSVMQQILAEITTSEPTEQQLQQYYEQHRSEYATAGTMDVRNLVLAKAGDGASQAAMTQARAAADALRAHTPIAEVMRKYGLTEAKEYGEDFYFAAKIHLGDALFAAATQLAEGAVSDPLPQADGIHILQIIKNTRPVPLSYALARSQVFTDYKDAAQMRLMAATVKFLRDRSKILIARDYAKDYKP